MKLPQWYQIASDHAFDVISGKATVLRFHD